MAESPISAKEEEQSPIHNPFAEIDKALVNVDDRLNQHPLNPQQHDNIHGLLHRSREFLRERETEFRTSIDQDLVVWRHFREWERTGVPSATLSFPPTDVVDDKVIDKYIHLESRLLIWMPIAQAMYPVLYLIARELGLGYPQTLDQLRDSKVQFQSPDGVPTKIPGINATLSIPSQYYLESESHPLDSVSKLTGRRHRFPELAVSLDEHTQKTLYKSRPLDPLEMPPTMKS